MKSSKMFELFPAGRGSLPRVLYNDDAEMMQDPLTGIRYIHSFRQKGGVDTMADIKCYEDMMTNRFTPALETDCAGWSICYNFGMRLWEPASRVIPGTPEDPLRDLDERWQQGKRRQFYLSMRVNDWHHMFYNKPRLWSERRIANKRFFINPPNEEKWQNKIVPWIREGIPYPPKMTDQGLVWDDHEHYGYEDFNFSEGDLAYDYTYPEVRQMYVDELEEATHHCDPDGVELDFLRFWKIFPTGKEKPELVNDFIRQVRAMLDRRANELGHPIKLIARAFCNFEESASYGHDTRTWLKEKLFDAVIAGRGFLYSHPCVEEFVDYAHACGVPVYGCFDYGHFWNTRFRTLEAMRGAMAAMWDLGIEGMYTFNLYSPAEYELLNDAASPERLANEVKEFFVDTGYLKEWPWPSGGLPAELPAGETTFNLYFAADPATADRLTVDFEADKPFLKNLKINGKPIQTRNDVLMSTAKDMKEVRQALVRGRNQITVEFTEPTRLDGIGILSVPFRQK